MTKATPPAAPAHPDAPPKPHAGTGFLLPPRPPASKINLHNVFITTVWLSRARSPDDTRTHPDRTAALAFAYSKHHPQERRHGQRSR